MIKLGAVKNCIPLFMWGFGVCFHLIEEMMRHLCGFGRKKEVLIWLSLGKFS